MNGVIVAIDGVSASGKGTVAAHIAKDFNFNYLDTGLIYRYLGYLALNKYICIEKVPDILKACYEINSNKLSKMKELLQDEKVAELASKIAKIQVVRNALLNIQRSFFDKSINKGYSGAVLDGRDIGTVIFPNAKFKFFITASLNIRVQRRYQQLLSKNIKVDSDQIKSSIHNRDLRDYEVNKVAKESNDYIIIDNSNLTIEQTFDLVKSYIK